MSSRGRRRQGPEPVGPAVTSGQQDCGSGRRFPASGQQSQAAIQVKVALRQPPPGPALGAIGEGHSRDAVPGKAVGAAGPLPRLGPSPRVQVHPAGYHGDDVRQPLVSQVALEQRQLGLLRQRVMLKAREQPGRQRT